MEAYVIIPRKSGISRRRRLRLVWIASAVLLASVGGPVRPANAYNLSQYTNTNGFDTCAAKTQAFLDAWWIGTPWFEIGVYLGGSAGQNTTDIHCYDGAAAVDRALNTGYGVVLYWYGPQMGPPCNFRSYWSYIGVDTTAAYNQGVAEARAANTAAISAKLPLGSRIFYDMEPLRNTAACRAAAKSFIDGWDHELGVNTAFWGAAFGSSCASFISDWATIANVPKAISPSDTDPTLVSGGLDNGSAFGYPCVGDGLWNQHQRVGQFSYDTNGKYNGVQRVVDENCADVLLPSIQSFESSGCSDVL